MKFNYFESQAAVQRHKDGHAELCTLKMQAILKAVKPHLKDGVDLEGLIRPIMEAESVLYTPKVEAAARRNANHVRAVCYSSCCWGPCAGPKEQAEGEVARCVLSDILLANPAREMDRLR